jgi:hypothetical protein
MYEKLILFNVVLQIWITFSTVDVHQNKLHHCESHAKKCRKNHTSIMMQINQPTRCNSFTSLLLDDYVWLNMFQALSRPLSGAYSCISSLWFYCRSVVVAALLVVVWQTMTNNATTTFQR